MAQAAKLTITTPRGTFTRRSDRPYTWAVATGSLTPTAYQRLRRDEIKHLRSLDAEYERHAADLEAGREWPRDSILLGKYGSRAAYAAKLREWTAERQPRIAQAEADLARGTDPDQRVMVTWHSTRALAQKELNKRVADGYTPVADGIFEVAR